jgi:hypothetical protein
MINDILTAIQERLAQKEPNIKYLDEDWGQLDYYNDNPPVQFPATLVDILDITWLNQSLKVQDGKQRIAIMVADIKKTNTSFMAPPTQKLAAAAIWIIIENIHKALQGWRPAGGQFGTLSRESTMKVKRDDGIRQFQLIYSCECTDASAMDQVYNIADPEVAASQFNTVPPDITVEVKTDLTD